MYAGGGVAPRGIVFVNKVRFWIKNFPESLFLARKRRFCAVFVWIYVKKGIEASDCEDFPNYLWDGKEANITFTAKNSIVSEEQGCKSGAINKGQR